MVTSLSSRLRRPLARALSPQVQAWVNVVKALDIPSAQDLCLDDVHCRMLVHNACSIVPTLFQTPPEHAHEAVRMIKFLIEDGKIPVVNETDAAWNPSSSTFLRLAVVHHAPWYMVRAIAEAHPWSTNRNNAAAYTSMLLAAEKRPALLNVLLHAGVPVGVRNAQVKGKPTLLQQALRTCSLKTVQRLLTAGATFPLVHGVDNSPFYQVSRNTSDHRPALLNFLRTSGHRVDAHAQRSLLLDQDVLKMPVDDLERLRTALGAHANVHDEEGRTMLHRIAALGGDDVLVKIQYAMDLGVDVLALDKDGHDASWCVRKKNNWRSTWPEREVVVQVLTAAVLNASLKGQVFASAPASSRRRL